MKCDIGQVTITWLRRKRAKGASYIASDAIRWKESERCTLFSEIKTNDDVDVKTVVSVLLLKYLINFVGYKEGF